MKFTRPTGVSQVPAPAGSKKQKNLIIKRSIRPLKSVEGNKSLTRPNVLATLKKTKSI